MSDERLQTSFYICPRHQGKDIFGDFISLLDLPYDSGENMVMFVKIGARVPELWLVTSSGLAVWFASGPNVVYNLQDPKGKVFFEIS